MFWLTGKLKSSEDRSLSRKEIFVSYVTALKQNKKRYIQFDKMTLTCLIIRTRLIELFASHLRVAIWKRGVQTKWNGSGDFCVSICVHSGGNCC